MIIFIEGEEPFLAYKAIGQIKQKYIDKNGLTELREIDGSMETEFNWADLQAIPLFASSRLIIIRQASLLKKYDQEALSTYLGHLPSTTVVVIQEGQPLPKGSPLLVAMERADKTIAALPIAQTKLPAYIKKQAEKYDLAISDGLSREIAKLFGGNLWAIETELAKMASQEQPSLEDKGLIAQADEPFLYFRLVRERQWAGLFKALVADYALGKPVELLIGSLASAIRKEIKARPQRVVLTDLLIDVDYAIKTGMLEPEMAIGYLAYHLLQLQDNGTGLVRGHLPKPSYGRVRWEEQWLTIHG